MHKSTAVVETEFASKYLQQLCKHWSHNYKVEFTPEKGVVDFGNEQVIAMEALDGKLLLFASDRDTIGLKELEDAVADHLLRFAFRESMLVSWTR